GVREVRRIKPPRVVVECWMSGFWRMHLATSVPPIPVTSLCEPGQEARSFEAWIHDNEAIWEPGTALVTGVGGCVHYNSYYTWPGEMCSCLIFNLRLPWQRVKIGFG